MPLTYYVKMDVKIMQKLITVKKCLSFTNETAKDD